MKSHRTRSSRRVLAATAAIAVAGVVTGAVPDARAAAGFELTRVAGVNRYATAASLANAAFPDGSDVAVLATGVQFADALAGSYLSGRFGAGAPILLTMPDSLPSETEAALDDLAVETVYLLGGTAAISEAVADSMGDRTVVRVAGANRYETAADIATLSAEGAADPGEVSGDPTVVIASGEGFADALAAGPVAFKGKLPVLLTPTAALHPAASGAIDQLDATRAIVVGGTAAVSAAVVTELEAKGMTVQRVAGPNRYATAVAIAGFGRSTVGLSASGVDLASGEDFPDALAAGPASGVANRPLVLTASDELSDDTEDYLVANSPTLTQGRVFGGTAAVSESTVNQAEVAGRTGDTVGANRIVAIDKTGDSYTYVEDGTDEAVEIDYSSTDDFTVDGADASVAGFESNITIGDIIIVDDVDSPSEHDLTNVSASSFTSGTVGNVDLADDQLDIIDPVTGAIFRRNITYSGTFRVNAGTTDHAGFEANLNEGDTIEIAGGFNLTNVTVAGAATDVAVTEPPQAVTSSARFTVDSVFGDIPGSGSDGVTDGANNDDTYRADCSPTVSSQAFNVDGDPEATCDEFVGALTGGDSVRYDRLNGVEIFTLVNVGGGGVSGTAVDGIDPDGDGDGEPPLGEDDDIDGGSFTMVDDDGDEVTVEYGPDGTFVVDGLVSNEATFEAEYSAGDEIVYRAADAASSTAQRLELDNADLRGDTTEVNTTIVDEPDPAEQNSIPAKSYTVALDGVELETVEYTRDDHPHTYIVNGTSRNLSCFEDALDSGDDLAITRAGGDTPYVEDAPWTHRITTAAGFTC